MTKKEFKNYLTKNNFKVIHISKLKKGRACYPVSDFVDKHSTNPKLTQNVVIPIDLGWEI